MPKNPKVKPVKHFDIEIDSVFNQNEEIAFELMANEYIKTKRKYDLICESVARVQVLNK